MEPSTRGMPWLILLLAGATSRVAVADDASAGAAIASSGSTSGAVACASCHGADGAGNAAAGFPALAGLDADYMARQLRLIRAGERASAVMRAGLGGITDEEIDAVATHYSTLPPAAAAGGSTEPLGRSLAESGDWPGRDLPACESCHGPGGVGVGPAFPAIAGQHAGYLAAQLRAWKVGERTTDPGDLMGTIARKLTEEEIDAVSAWFSAQPLRGER